jgi:preprotein translocase subunit SecE
MAEKTEAAPRRSLIQRIVNYFREARGELSRVTWPTREEIMQSTQVILLFAIAFMIILGSYDAIFRALTRLLGR